MKVLSKPKAAAKAKAAAKVAGKPKVKAASTAKPADKANPASSSNAAWKRVPAVVDVAHEELDVSAAPEHACSRMLNYLKYQANPQKNKRGSSESIGSASAALEATLFVPNLTK